MEALIALGIVTSACIAYCLWCCFAVNHGEDE
jgi:hypothetical protein